MSDIEIPKGGVFAATWYVSGTTLTGAYARMVGYTSPSSGSPYLFDWTTSGGQLLVTGSTVSGGRVDAWVNTSGTSGLSFTIGAWQLGVSLGSVQKFYDAGRVDLVGYDPRGL